MNPYIFPAESGFATFAVNVGHGVQSSQQHALFSRTTTNVYHWIEEVGATLTSLERLWNEFIVIGQMSTTVDARVRPVTVGQISLERFHHATGTAAALHAVVHRRVTRRMDTLEPGGVLTVSHESLLISLLVVSTSIDSQNTSNPLASWASPSLCLAASE